MLEQLKRKFRMSDSQFAGFSGCLKKLEVPAKTTLLKEGEIAKKIFFIEKGCIRVWFNNDGKDLTTQFFFENETVASIESLKKQVPSLLNIETIEPCVLWHISKQDLEKILPELENVSELRDEFINNLFDRMFHYMNHFFSFLRDSPLKRYQVLMQEKPMIIQRVPQHYIASYLGVSSVHLSRIKSQLIREKT
ncbi:Crp/Fnr family transcriptional regulator [Pedobacter cryoconitis]|uniref:Crp/Fnr family transcriptional regulator n=1 Tax=Pedobacter cryoconitis TaxID=188932 RepID=UPI00160B99F5|nr:Crp/Fnr family transcriptional regulator [Pedobacter cryoconitis]MBB5645039.1 CRP-like cAMP-binding protein [Pedobacter cryoconitis]